MLAAAAELLPTEGKPRGFPSDGQKPTGLLHASHRQSEALPRGETWYQLGEAQLTHASQRRFLKGTCAVDWAGKALWLWIGPDSGLGTVLAAEVGL